MTDMFEATNPDVKIIAELAKETEIADPIDWCNLNISEEQAYIMMASHAAEMEVEPLVMKSLITKLLVENFVLNVKLMQSKGWHVIRFTI